MAPGSGRFLQRARLLLLLAAPLLLLYALLNQSVLPHARLRWKVYRLYWAELPRYLPELTAAEGWQHRSVPPVVHFVVPSNASRWPPIWTRCHASWREQLPGHTLRFWNDEEMEALVARSYPQFLPVYTQYTRQIQRADMARYLILHSQGGIYADSDYQCVRAFDHLLPPGKVAVAESPHSGEVVQNALLASPAGHPFWAYVLRELLANVFVDDVVLSTGPRAVLHAVDKAPRGWVTLLPRERFARWPGQRLQHHKNRVAQALYSGRDVYAVHIGTGSWERKDNASTG